MSESQTPVAASISDIEAAFPKAKAEFVLKCVKRQLPMASVLSEALSAMDEELTAVKAQLAEALSKAAAPPMEEEVVVEEEPVEAKAKAVARTGVKPVAKTSTGSKPSAKAEWFTKINAKVQQGFSKDKAVVAVNRENPGLRSQMLAETNS